MVNYSERPVGGGSRQLRCVRGCALLFSHLGAWGRGAGGER